MRSKKIAAALAALTIGALLGGCQLALAGDGEDAGRDTFCGVFITLDYMDISEPEISMNWNGEAEFTYPEQRVWATRSEDENGAAEFTFEGVEGFRFFAVTVEGEGHEPYRTSMTDGPIQDVFVSYTDEGVSLSGTIYFDVQCRNCTLYPNPVYQTPEGDVYMVPGTGTGIGSMGEGSSITTTLSETATETVNGEETSRTIEVEIKAESLNTNQKVVLKQMEKKDQVISQAEITQNDIPDTIAVQPDCAYMIIEEHSIDYYGKSVVERTLLGVDETYITVRFTGDNGIVEAYPVTLELPAGAGA